MSVSDLPPPPPEPWEAVFAELRTLRTMVLRLRADLDAVTDRLASIAKKQEEMEERLDEDDYAVDRRMSSVETDVHHLRSDAWALKSDVERLTDDVLNVFDVLQYSTEVQEQGGLWPKTERKRDYR